MFKLLSGLGGWKAYLIGGAALFAFGCISGGYTIHKFYQAGEVASLKAEIDRRDKADKERNRVAADLAAANRTREGQLSDTIEGLKAHEQALSSCPVAGDVGRLLNSHR